jgi:hypothetical protein
MSFENVKNYRKQESTGWVIGGDLEITTGGRIFDVNGKQDDLRVPATATKLGGSKEPGFTTLINTTGGSTGVFAYQFDKTTQEQLFFAVQIPHDHVDGTPLIPHVHWCPTSTSTTGSVTWGLEKTFTSIDGTFSRTDISRATGACGGKWKHTLTNFANISTTGITGYSPMLLCRVFRDSTNALDTYGADAALLEIDFHFQRGSFGST